MAREDSTCPSGVCGADVPPLVGSVLTDTGVTLPQAAAALAAGEPLPPLTEVQRRLVEEAAARGGYGALGAGSSLPRSSGGSGSSPT